MINKYKNIVLSTLFILFFIILGYVLNLLLLNKLAIKNKGPIIMTQAEQDKSWFKKCLEKKELAGKLKKIKLVIADIDGSLTDGQIYLADNISSNKSVGQSRCKNFSIQDGYAIVNAVKNNHLLIAFVSGRDDKATSIRAKMLGIPDNMCYLGGSASKNKQANIQSIQKNNNVTKDETILFGDDFLDFNAKQEGALMACPENTPFYFQHMADLVIPKSAGNNSFRLLLDLILYIQKKHFAQDFIKKALSK